MVYNLQCKLCPVSVPQFTSFECLVLSVTATHSAAIATIYRPPKSNAEFLSEFADLLTMLCIKFERILILGDLNIHVDQKDCVLAKDFLSLLDCFNFTQFVNVPTHWKGHTLDLVTANYAFVSNLSTVDVGLSDHSAILFNLEVSYSLRPVARTVSFRKCQSVDPAAFANSINACLDDLSSVPSEHKIILLNNALAANLDMFAPI